MIELLKKIIGLKNNYPLNHQSIYKELNRKIKFDDDLFIQRLREAATWLEYVTPNNGSKLFRSIEIQPEELLHDVDYIFARQSEIINQVIEKRSQVLFEKNIPLIELEQVIEKGFLLYAYVNQSVTDGASEAESNCLFDSYDIPAWDTWIWWQKENNEEILIAWIPSSQVYYAEQANAVNCVDCIRWAATVQNQITDRLSKYGLIKMPDVNNLKIEDQHNLDNNFKILEEIYESIKRKKIK